MTKYICEECVGDVCSATNVYGERRPPGCVYGMINKHRWRKVEPAEPDEPDPYVPTDPLLGLAYWYEHFGPACPDCAKYKRLSAEKDNILRSVNEEKDSEIRHLRGMLRQATEECTGCESLREELAHCESALIECQENAAQPSVEDYNDEVTRTNAANMAAANKYNAMVDKNNSGQGKKLDKILALLKTWEPK